MFPEADKVVSTKYAELRALENAGTKGIDRVSDVFASMLGAVAKLLLGDKASDDSLRLVYNIGKFVYLVDALDDIDEDHRAGRYNVFLAEMPYSTRAQFFADNKETIEFILNVTINRAIECFNHLTFTQSYDLLRKTVHIGLRQKAAELMASDKKLKRPIVRSEK